MDGVGGLGEPSHEVALAQVRVQVLAKDPAGVVVGEDVLDSVPDLEAGAVLLDGDDDEDPTVPELPVIERLAGGRLDGAPLQLGTMRTPT